MLFDLDPLNVFIFLSGVAFLFKKVADMDRYHELRVLLLTTVLSTIVIVLFFGYCFPRTPSCMRDIPEDGFSVEY
jgi:predicted secreted protein